MARSKDEILATMVAEKETQSGLSGLTNSSQASIWRLLFMVVAYCIHVLEVLFDTHMDDVDAAVKAMKPHSAQWYAWMAKRFQFGSSLVTDSDSYDNSSLTDDEVEEQQIVKYAAISTSQRQLRIKVATLQSGDLAPLTAAQLSAFSAYIAKIKDAGVFTNITSEPAEELKLSVTIYYNPEVLSSAGDYIDGSGDNVIASTIKKHLTGIDFDGELILAKLVDDLQALRGVEIPHITLAQYKYGSISWTDIDIFRRPLAGYIRILDANLSITYIAR